MLINWIDDINEDEKEKEKEDEEYLDTMPHAAGNLVRVILITNCSN